MSNMWHNSFIVMSKAQKTEFDIQTIGNSVDTLNL